jgi:polysaccharide biosynthesis PFTS motif protein
MRGYYFLKKKNSLGAIMDAKNILVDTPLSIPKNKTTDFFFASASSAREGVTRDFLVRTVGHYSLNKSLLASLGEKNGKLVFPLPRIWISALKTQGWNISDKKCACLWVLFLLLCWLYGVLTLIKTFFYGLMAGNKKNKESSSNRVHFCGLSENEIVSSDSNKNYNIISWYLQWSGRAENMDEITHNIKTADERMINKVRIAWADPLEPIRGLKCNLLFLSWGVGAALLSLIKLIKGNWWYPLMLKEMVVSQIHKRNNFFAEVFMFPAYEKRQRAWTYEAEKKGSQNKLYFYSTNTVNVLKSEKLVPESYHFRKISWPEILVWDQHQKRALESFQAEGVIREVGPIWFSDADNAVPCFTKKTIALFDVTPRRISTYAWLGIRDGYYLSENINRFLDDIVNVAETLKWQIAWKGKRDLKSKDYRSVPKNYLKRINRLVNNKRIIPIQAGVSAIKLIEKCHCTISLPFSSPSIMALSMGRKSCFYNPSEGIKVNEDGAHGVLIIHGKTQLKEFLSNETTHL